MEITRGQPDDITSALAIIKACVAHMRQQGIEQWDEIYPDEATLSGDIAGGTLHVARDGGMSLGIIVLNEDQPSEYEAVNWRYREGRILVVHRLAVDPKHQGKGVAQELMRFAEEHAMAGGYAAIRLDTFTRNPGAVRLYERLGYRRAGQVTFRKGVFWCYEKRPGTERRRDEWGG